MNFRKSFGRWGEKTAEEFLANLGYLVIGKNIRTPYGEIDLVVEQEGVVIFVEVKTRSSNQFGLPEEGITLKKQEHMKHAAEFFMQAHPELRAGYRIDVIAIQKLAGTRLPEIVHFENVIC